MPFLASIVAFSILQNFLQLQNFEVEASSEVIHVYIYYIYNEHLLAVRTEKLNTCIISITSVKKTSVYLSKHLNIICQLYKVAVKLFN